MADKKILASAIEVVTKISDGSKIKSVQYQAGASGTTAPTGTWSNNVVATSADKPYLWTKTIYEYEGKDSEPVYTVGGTIEGVQVGGRNLIQNSEIFDPSLSSFKDSNVTVLTTYHVFDGTTMYTASGPRYMRVNFPTLIIGKQYTFGIEAARHPKASSQTIFITIDGETTSVGTAIDTAWTKFHVIFTATSTSTYAKIQVNNIKETGNDGVVIGARHIKLEIGNQATDWTPAPEDVDSAISTAQSTAISTSNKYTDDQVAPVSKSVSSATTRISDAEGEIKSITTNVTKLGTRVTTCETDIKSANDAIALRATKKEVDKAISDTKTDLESKINVKAGEITSSVSETYATQKSLSELKQTSDSLSFKIDTIQAQDPYNYSQLNDTTATGLGFTADSTADGHWYTLGTLARDTRLSDWITCTGGERLKITGSISSTVKGASTSGGSAYLAADIMITSKDAEDGNTINVYSNDVTSSESGTAGSVSKVVTLDSTARKFIIYLHLKGYPTFSGKIKIRNLKIEKVDDQALSEAMADSKKKADAAAKTATNYLGFDQTNGLIVGNKTSGTLSGANVQIKSDGINIRTGTTDTCSRATVTADGLKVYDTYGTTELASFGSTATIGKTSENHLIMDGNCLKINSRTFPLARFGKTNDNDPTSLILYDDNANRIFWVDGYSTHIGFEHHTHVLCDNDGFHIVGATDKTPSEQKISSFKSDGVRIGLENSLHTMISTDSFRILSGENDIISIGSNGIIIGDDGTKKNIITEIGAEGITTRYSTSTGENPYKSYFGQKGIKSYAKPDTADEYPNFYLGVDGSNITMKYNKTDGGYKLSGQGSIDISASVISALTMTATGKITAKQLETSDYVVAAANMVFGDSEYTTERGIKTKFKDGSRHGVVTRVGTGGLTINFGWKGSNRYKTITQISGQTVQYINSSGTTTLSDKRLKTDFTELDNWDTFFDNLKPCAFKYKNGASGRYHLGFIAQEVEEALDAATLTNQDFGGIVKFPYRADEKDEEDAEFYEENGIKDGDDEYGLIYTEFTALNTHEIQKLKKENKELKLRVSDLEGRVSALESLMNMVSAYILDQNGNNDTVYG